jgi:Na+/phosphate symporter
MSKARHTKAELTAYAGSVQATVKGCRMYVASCTCNDLSPEEQEANAVLFAAAPDLLAVARLIVQAEEETDPGTGLALFADAVVAARIAIAKAKGETE